MLSAKTLLGYEFTFANKGIKIIHLGPIAPTQVKVNLQLMACRLLQCLFPYPITKNPSYGFCNKRHAINCRLTLTCVGAIGPKSQKQRVNNMKIRLFLSFNVSLY